MSLVPKISAGGIITAIKSPEVLAVGAAVLFSSTITGYVAEMLGKFVPTQYLSWAILGLSVIVLLVATKIKSVVLRAVAIGFAGANVFTAVYPIVQKHLIARLN